MATILVVEDESDLRSAIVDELNDEGHITIEAENGAEGLKRLAAETPDLILSDITMPEMNGYQFFRSIKERHPEHTQTPFIFLTALAGKEDELKGLRLGVDEYITKPIDFDLLTARIEVALRRRQPQTGPSSPMPESAAGRQQASSIDQGSETPIQKLDDIIQDSGGQVLTGKFETVSLEAVRKKMGDRWSEMSDALLATAETTIREHLGPNDAFHILPSNDFIVCFDDRSEERVDAKVSLIRDAIWDRLFSQTGDEDLSSVGAQSFELELSHDPSKDADEFFSEVADAFDQQRKLASEGSRSELSKIYQYEELYALTLLTPQGTPSKIKSLSFEKKLNNRAKKLFDGGRYDGAFLLELKESLFERLKEKQSIKKAFDQAAMLLPVQFDMVSDPKARDGLITLCKDLEKSIRVTLIIEVVNTPDRIASQVGALTPLPIGRKLQFLEIRRTSQLNDFDLSQLKELSIPFVSMSFDNTRQHEEKKLVHFVQNLNLKGVKLFVKEVPEGKLYEAQFSKGGLYAIRR